jgi:formylglycine-generating enzyme required for sulfatase activity
MSLFASLYSKNGHASFDVWLDGGQTMCAAFKDGDGITIGLLPKPLWNEVKWNLDKAALLRDNSYFMRVCDVRIVKSDCFAMTVVDFVMPEGKIVRGKTDPNFAQFLVGILVKYSALATADGAGACAAPVQGQAWTLPALNLQLLPIPAGSFEMGSIGGGDAGHPVTQVLLSAFWLGRTEVTQDQWASVMSDVALANFIGGDRPVANVSWKQATEFCRRVTAQEAEARRMPAGLAYTLPTEAQWEYACRAGTTGDYAGDLDAMAWYDKNSGNMTHPVATKQANAWGLYDMHGNVREWCRDWLSDKLPGGSVTDPTGPASGTVRVFRGGYWLGGVAHCRSAHRSGAYPSDRTGTLGFRLALAPSP